MNEQMNSIIVSRQDGSSVREILTESMGNVLTPELCARIDFAAARASGIVTTQHADARALGLSGRTPDQLAVMLLQGEQAEAPVIHRFGPGLYIRELHMSAGGFAVGRKQKCRHVNVMLKGKVEMFSQDGTSRILEAPMFFIGEPGQKVGYVIEDTVWQNIYATDETDIDRLEEMFMESDVLDKSEAERFARETVDRKIDRDDFAAMVNEIGLTPKEVHAQASQTADRASFPTGQWDVRISKSPIEGVGLFATRPFHPGDIICPARIGNFRTPAGRYINHSTRPNCEFVAVNGSGINLVAIRSISGCVGGQIGEELTVCYRHARNVALTAEIGGLV